MLPLILATFVFCFLLERSIPGWKLPQVKTWPLRVLLINFVQLGVVLLGGLTWEKWFQDYSVFQLSSIVGPLAGGAIAYFIATFIFYWWHRWRHESDFLWRMFHQIHHSPQRLEVITSFYKHPQEMIANSIIGGLLVFVLLGLDPLAGAYYTMFTALGEFFYHTNVKTPRWVGYFFQRPEMHRIHHKFGKHKNNYGDIVWWDMLFGTYENPKEWNGKCGFETEKELRLIEMLKTKDVHKESAVKKTTSKVAAAILVSLLAVPGWNSRALACSVYAQKTKNDAFYVAKNFDWNSPEGFIVKNPRGVKRKSFYADARTDWTSRYASTSFTAVGPGLPVSSMNERGLVVEALVNHDYQGSLSKTGALTVMEWAQYVLDNFESVDQVEAFAKKRPFVQLAVPLHLFVCDADQTCAVISSESERKLDVRRGKNLKANVLANRDWDIDYHNSRIYNRRKSSYFFGFDVVPGYTSYRRFGNLLQQEESSRASSSKDIFESLDGAKIDSLIQWQVIWKPREQKVVWRTFRDEEPGQIFTMNLKETKKSCRGYTEVASLKWRDKPNFVPYSQSHKKLVEQSLSNVLDWRGIHRPKGFERSIVAFTDSAKCVMRK